MPRQRLSTPDMLAIADAGDARQCGGAEWAVTTCCGVGACTAGRRGLFLAALPSFGSFGRLLCDLGLL